MNEETSLRVVDTNVAIVANGSSDQADDSLVEKCIDAILKITGNGGLVLDRGDRIFNEYRSNLNLGGQPGTGDLFMKWVHDFRWNPDWCELREVNCSNEEEQLFHEFPEHPDLDDFDVSDRKFIAVANAGKVKAPILQAVDFKWWGWRDALQESGIEVRFLDEEAAREGYRKHQLGK